ncbi:hypothetical protein [Luteolibacter luteus]|uniref:Uncharacterized protein n=1 Tax=Luteolibacter luteus TaxID=2728835 RepID=A0A858RHC4_9BACT|nr:hypothetical protein [Luteolibacter luteus]QJE96277.1 hypothetical protein HHL09_10935 [Luteolibacter luteus]
MDARKLLLSWLIPGIAGLGTGVVLMTPDQNPKEAKTIADSTAKSSDPALPDDPVVIQMAALAGRTGEARKKIEALFADNATDEQIADWLAPILIADPAWLESFVLDVHESRRIDLVRATLWKMSEISPDAVWELVRSSPFAAKAARTTGSDTEREGLEVLNGCHDSPLAAEILFDPANGFSKEEATHYFRFGTRSRENCSRILNEWFGGLWEGKTPECVRSAWLQLRYSEEPTLRELEKHLPDALKEQAGRFEAFDKLMPAGGMITSDPTPEDLGQLGAEELAQLAEMRTEAGTPLSLETLAKLPPELRGQTFQTYFAYLYPYNEEAAEHALETIDKLGLKREERQALLDGAVSQIWQFEGDPAKALALIDRMPDREAAATTRAEILEELAKFDPQAALETAKSLPEGELREKIEELAREGLQ